MSLQTELEEGLAEAESLHQRGDLVGAVRLLVELSRRGQLFEESAALFLELGIILYELKFYERSVTAFRRVTRIDSTHANAFLRLGAAQHFSGDLTGACASYERCVELNPKSFAAFMNRGLTLFGLERHSEALESLQHAADLAAHDSNTWANLAVVQSTMGLFDEALQSVARVDSLEAGHAGAQLTRAQIDLLRGRFEEGWKGYAARHSVRQLTEHTRVSTPPWQGEALGGKRIHLIAEQGLGDTTQFLRLAKPLKEQGAEVVVTMPKSLHALFADFEWIDEVSEDTEVSRPCDYHALILDLPHLLNIAEEDIPLAGRYIRTHELGPGLQSFIASHERKVNVGLVWRGNPGHANDRYRSMRLHHWKPLVKVEGVRVFSLQHGDPDSELSSSAWAHDIIDLDAEISSVDETLAAMSALDLVITIDSFPAHLSGAAGLPTWVVLALSPDWRWMLERDDSPWYASARLFRQSQFASWDGVVADVCSALTSLVQGA